MRAVSFLTLTSSWANVFRAGLLALVWPGLPRHPDFPSVYGASVEARPVAEVLPGSPTGLSSPPPELPLCL